MTGIRPYLAVLCALMLLTPAGGFAADPPQAPKPSQPQQNPPGAGSPEPGVVTDRSGIIGRLSGPYRPIQEPPNNLNNSNRIEQLLRAGNLYLSMQDAIALALENNLDIAIQRYGPQLADAALLSAQAGAFPRGVSTRLAAGRPRRPGLGLGHPPGGHHHRARPFHPPHPPRRG